MLFNVYYSGSSPTDFTVDLTENAIIRPNSVARLLKAYIPHKKAVTLTRDKIMDLVINDRDSSAIAIDIAAAGTFSISDLATQITNALNAAFTGDDSNYVGSCSYDRTKGHGAGALTINIKATTQYFSDIEFINWTTTPYSDADYLVVEDVAGVTQNAAYTKLGNRALNMSVEDVGTGVAPAVGSFAQVGFTGTTKLKLDYFSKKTATDANVPPSQYGEFGCVIYELGSDIGTRSFWAGASTGQSKIADRQPNNDIGFLDKLNNVPFAMFIPKTTRGAGSPNNSGTVAYTAGGFYAWELKDDGDLNLVSAVNDVGLVAGDQIAAVVSEGQHVEYWYKDNTGIWEKLDVIDGRERYVVQTDDTLQPAFSIFESTAADQEVMKFIESSLDDGDINDYGKYAKATLTTEFASALGFTSSPYVEDADVLANLKFSNEEEFTIVETSEDCPFVNINITNLPLKAYVNYDTRQVGISNAPTLGTISRFDRDGSMTKPEALYMDYPTHTAPLDNANEIYISQLKFQLRDNNGKVPTDLDSPLSLVFEIEGSR